MSNVRGIFGRLTRKGKEIGEDFSDEFLTNPRFARMISSVVSGIEGTKENLDKNIRFLLNTINLPSKSDYKELINKLEMMNQAVSGLESRIDDIIAASAKLAEKSDSTKSKK